jgi:hypothetical protein
MKVKTRDGLSELSIKNADLQKLLDMVIGDNQIDEHVAALRALSSLF